MTATLIRGGRVIDPGDGTDAVRDLLIKHDRIKNVGQDLADTDGATVIEATGLIVGPGFVDLHSHVNAVAGQRLQAFDGVTTALELELGMFPIARAYERAAADGRPLNYGFSASWTGARAVAQTSRDLDAAVDKHLAVLSDPDWQRSASPAELSRWLDILRGELADGALGIGVILGYAPRTDPAEYVAVGRLAAEGRAPVYTHVRELVEVDPDTPVDGSREVLAVAAETGVQMHHCHINSTSRRHIDRVLSDIERSQTAGARVTIEAYPYGAGSTAVGAFFLEPDRLRAWGVKPSNIVLLPTGERIENEQRLREIREMSPGTACVVEFFDESDPADRAILERGLRYVDSIVASDAMPIFFPDGSPETRVWPLPADGSTHPRTAGTFARAARRMVREEAIWSWSELFRRSSYLPARVLDEVASAARDIGHLGAGAWADIVVLDPATFTDTATYLAPTQSSYGVHHLFVSGERVIADGQLVESAYPGRPIRA